MKAEIELSKTLDEMFCSAFLLTGSIECAEEAVINAIEACDSDDIVDESLFVEMVRSAIELRTTCRCQSKRGDLFLPLELWRLFQLQPVSRDCYILRILLRMPCGTCAHILHLTVDEVDDALLAALRELPLLERTTLTSKDSQSPNREPRPVARVLAAGEKSWS